MFFSYRLTRYINFSFLFRPYITRFVRQPLTHIDIHTLYIYYIHRARVNVVFQFNHLASISITEFYKTMKLL